LALKSRTLNNQNDRLVLLFNLKFFIPSISSKKRLLILFYEIDINLFKTHIFYLEKKSVPFFYNFSRTQKIHIIFC